MIQFMPQNDPTEELFRQSAHLLEQRPSLQSWRRLEQRLDRRQSKQSLNRLPAWAYAAAVLLLALTTVGLLQLPSAADQTFAQRPESIEELDRSTGSIPATLPYQGIQDGSSTETLQVRNSGIPSLLPAPKYRL